MSLNRPSVLGGSLSLSLYISLGYSSFLALTSDFRSPPTLSQCLANNCQQARAACSAPRVSIVVGAIVQPVHSSTSCSHLPVTMTMFPALASILPKNVCQFYAFRLCELCFLSHLPHIRCVPPCRCNCLGDLSSLYTFPTVSRC